MHGRTGSRLIDAAPSTITQAKGMDLKRRLAKLESRAAGCQARMEPVYSEEDLAIMRRIVERTYADPVRYASRIALFERSGLSQEQASSGSPDGQPVAGSV